ncbi:hypothetical protein ACHAW6_006399 [Cyclotella cf. meneghiniana]
MALSGTSRTLEHVRPPSLPHNAKRGPRIAKASECAQNLKASAVVTGRAVLIFGGIGMFVSRPRMRAMEDFVELRLTLKIAGVMCMGTGSAIGLNLCRTMIMVSKLISGIRRKGTGD